MTRNASLLAMLVVLWFAGRSPADEPYFRWFGGLRSTACCATTTPCCCPNDYCRKPFPDLCRPLDTSYFRCPPRQCCERK